MPAPLFRIAALIPCYNHGEAVKHVVAALRAENMPVIIVDDGSNTRTRNACDALKSRDVIIVHRTENGGKGAAMKTGFKVAKGLGFTHVLQIDADGQHDTGEVPRFVRLAQKYPDALICGEPVYDKSIPRSRLFGRKLTNFWVAVNGLTLSVGDAMCGMRVYPLASTCALISRVSLGSRMDFDPEILVRLLWMGLRIKNIPVRVTYPLDGISHFEALSDNLRISWMHTRLCCNMLLRFPVIAFSRLSGVTPTPAKEVNPALVVKTTKIASSKDAAKVKRTPESR